jgi:hypothetical protein
VGVWIRLEEGRNRIRVIARVGVSVRVRIGSDLCRRSKNKEERA